MKEQKGNYDVRKVLTTLRAMIHLKAAQMVLDDGMKSKDAQQLIADRARLKNWHVLMSNINTKIAKGRIKRCTLVRFCNAIGTTYEILMIKAGIK